MSVIAQDAGNKPQLGWLPVVRLKIDHAYQRTLESRRSQKLIEKLIQKFNWSAFQAIVATKNGDDWTVIDGQHRVEAARLRGETHVPAVIIDAISLADQAAVFVAANQDRVAVNQFALYHAKLAAKDETALRVDAFCQEFGISIPRSTVLQRHLKCGQTLAIATITKLVENDIENGREAIALLLDLWPDTPGVLSALLIKTAAVIIDEFPNNRDEFKAFLGKQEPQVWAEEYGKGGIRQLCDDARLVLASKSTTNDRSVIQPGKQLSAVAPDDAEDEPRAKSEWIFPPNELVDPERRKLRHKGGWIAMTKTEWGIFERLAQSGGKRVTSQQLFDHLYWDDLDGGPELKIIDVFICKIRPKIPFNIETVRGEGFILHGYKLEKAPLTPSVTNGLSKSQLMGAR